MNYFLLVTKYDFWLIVLSLKYNFPVLFFYLSKIFRQYFSFYLSKNFRQYFELYLSKNWAITFYFYLSKNFEYFAEHCKGRMSN